MTIETIEQKLAIQPGTQLWAENPSKWPGATLYMVVAAKDPALLVRNAPNPHAPETLQVRLAKLQDPERGARGRLRVRVLDGVT